MKTIDIIGDNYLGRWDKTRTACRGIIIDGSKMLLSYASKNEQWMLPGGGLEAGEDNKACCIREIREETGFIVDVSDCMLEIDEYYGTCKWVNRYFICRVIGKAEMELTKREQEVGLMPIWIDIDEIKGIFSKHSSYAGADEMTRGMYLREYTALTELGF